MWNEEGNNMQVINVFIMAVYLITRMRPDASSNRYLCFGIYVKRLISELGVDRFEAVEETLEHLDTKTRV
jgi:hypothetical protein